MAYGPAGEVRTVGADGAVFTWDSATGRRLGAREAPGVTAAGGAAKAVPSPDGRWVLTYSRKPAGQYPEWAADLRDAITGETRQSWGVNGPVRSLVPVPGGPLLIGVVEESGVVGAMAWDTTTGRPVAGFGVSLDRARSRYAVSPDGSVFWVVDEERATGYDPTTGRERFAWKLADQDVLGRPVPKGGRRPGLVWGVAASPDGKTLAVAVGGEMYTDAAKRTHNLVLVEAATGKVLRRVPTAERPPTWLAFSPDGTRLAGAGGVGRGDAAAASAVPGGSGGDSPRVQPGQQAGGDRARQRGGGGVVGRRLTACVRQGERSGTARSPPHPRLAAEDGRAALEGPHPSRTLLVTHPGRRDGRRDRHHRWAVSEDHSRGHHGPSRRLGRVHPPQPGGLQGGRVCEPVALSGGVPPLRLTPREELEEHLPPPAVLQLLALHPGLGHQVLQDGVRLRGRHLGVRRGPRQPEER